MDRKYRVASALLVGVTLFGDIALGAQRGAAGGFPGGIGGFPGAAGGFPAGAGNPGNAGSLRGSIASDRAADRANPNAAFGLSKAAAATDVAASRQSRVDHLYRGNRKQLEFDPRHQLIVRDEILALVPDGASTASWIAQGFSVLRRESLPGIGLEQVVLAPPKGRSTKRALESLEPDTMDVAFDYNHIYLPAAADVAPGSALPPAPRVAAPDDAAPAVRVGLIDGGVQGQHPSLRGIDIHQRPCGGAEKPDRHGTAVASVLLGDAVTRAKAQLFAADVYCGSATGGSADAIIKSLAWMAEQGVAVINVSLVGPPNTALERIVKLLVSRGHLIVAAVGNDGPAAPPLYPAAYPGVIAVTGVDRDNKVLLEAGRGPYLHFAAPGADITAAQLPDGAVPVRGTSFAAPYVAARLARRLQRPDPALAAQLLREQEAQAVDLGAPGFDPVFGYGCLGCRIP